MDVTAEPKDGATPGPDAPVLTRLPGIGGAPPDEAIRRILITSAWFGGLAALAGWAFLGWPWALGFVGGALVGAANLMFLTALARLVLVPGRKNVPSILGVVSIKVLVVYGGLAGLLLWHLLPVLAVVCGFSLVLVVITLKAGGRALMASGWLGPVGAGKERGDAHAGSEQRAS